MAAYDYLQSSLPPHPPAPYIHPHWLVPWETWLSPSSMTLDDVPIAGHHTQYKCMLDTILQALKHEKAYPVP